MNSKWIFFQSRVRICRSKLYILCPTIQNIEQGISNIDEESRNTMARLFGYERFMNNLNQKKLYKKILDHILYLHSTAQINEMLEYLKKI